MGAQRRRNYNFRQSNRERNAESSYGNFKKSLANKFNKLVFKKYGKN